MSDEFYHELAQVQMNVAKTSYLILLCQVAKELPRLHHVKELRKELNTHVKPIRLDPPYMGCYRHVRALVSATLETTVSRERLVSAYSISQAHLSVGSQLQKTTNPPSGKVVLTLSGDGTSFSSTSSFVFLSFSFPNLASDTLAASGITISIQRTLNLTF